MKNFREPGEFGDGANMAMSDDAQYEFNPAIEPFFERFTHGHRAVVAPPYITPTVDVRRCVFSGANEDGSNAIMRPDQWLVFMHDWYCIGPVFCGKRTWKQRLAHWLLGVVVEERRAKALLDGGQK